MLRIENGMSPDPVLVLASVHSRESIHEMEMRKPFSSRTAPICLGIPTNRQGRAIGHTYRQDVRGSSVDPSQKNILTWEGVDEGEQT